MTEAIPRRSIVRLTSLKFGGYWTVEKVNTISQDDVCVSGNNSDVTLSSPAEIYQHWYTASTGSPCDGCDRRDTNCVSRPFYGIGDFNASVMYLGHDPGGASGVDESSEKWYNQGRRWKDYPGTPEERTEYKAPPSFEREPFCELPNRIAELKMFVNRLVDNDISGYYTNCVKCNEIHSHEENSIDNVDDLNSNGKQNCVKSYLHEEIKSVRPDVVVISSYSEDNHLDDMYDFFKVGETLPTGSNVKDYVWTRPESEISGPSDVIPTGYSKKYDSVVVPAYHFSYAGSSVQDYLSGDGEDLRDSILSPPRSGEGGQQDWYHGLLADVVQAELSRIE